MEKLLEYQPYFKYILIFLWIVSFTIVNSIFVRDEKLRKWLLSSFEEQEGRSSGKAFTAFFLVQVIIVALLAAVLYSPNHIMPESMFDSILIFIGSLYSIKLIGKYGGKLGSFNGGNGDSANTSDKPNSNSQDNNQSENNTQNKM